MSDTVSAQHIAVAADPGVGALCANRLGPERDLPARGDHLGPFGQQQRDAWLLARPCRYRDGDIRVVEIGRRLEAPIIVLVNQKEDAL